jgi:aspartate ammonia-lyase
VRRIRYERDSLGRRALPADAYYGIHTLRAAENFQITGLTIGRHPELIAALAAVKQAAAEANRELGVLEPARARAIRLACEELRAGRLHDQFIVDVIQGGAGTSTNMNANEVIANRGLEHLGRLRGAYAHLHPLDDVNRSQSTNDVYPTAVRVALRRMSHDLRAALARLVDALRAKAGEFADIAKIGRTQLQDAVPMTLGREFGAWAAMLAEEDDRLREAADLMAEVNLGGTAIGSGLNAPPGYPELAREHLSELVGMRVLGAPDLLEATQDTGALVHYSGALKRVALKLSKVSNDLRLLSSGPLTGLAEIGLPSVQAGSSMMPGKVNPVIPEVVTQVAFGVVGADLTVTMVAEAGQLQLNAFQPIAVVRLMESTSQLAAATDALAQRCVADITVRRERLAGYATGASTGLATALAPHLGYVAAARLEKDALAADTTLAELVVARGLMSRERVEDLLQHRRAPARG